MRKLICDDLVNYSFDRVIMIVSRDNFFGLIIIPMEVLDKADKKQAEKLNCWREQMVISENSEGLRCWSF